MKKRDFLKTTGAGLGATALTGLAAIKAEAESGAAPGAQVTEREWARALARHVAEQLPEAVRLVPGVQSCLSEQQVQELRRAYENVLITNMGCLRRG